MAEDIQFTERLAAAFGLRQPLGPLQGADRGAMGEVSRLETAAGVFAAKRLFDWARDDRIAVETTVTDAAVAAGIATPCIVRALGGEVILAFEGARWRMFSWIDLGPVFTMPPPAAAAREVGTMLARLHGLQLRADRSEVIPWFTARRGIDVWQRVARLARRERAPWATTLHEALDDYAQLLSATDPAAEHGPCVLSHCDLTLKNVRPHGGGLGLIDWEHAGAIPPLWELALVLYMWTPAPTHPAFPEIARALASGYRDAGGSTQGLDLQSFAGTVSAQLNWTLGRVYAALTHADQEERALALRQAGELLESRLTLQRLKALLAAASGP